MRDDYNDNERRFRASFFPSDVRSIRHTETYNVIVRIYIYRLASISQSNVIYEADSPDVFNAGRKLLDGKSVTWRITYIPRPWKMIGFLTKRLPLNRATGAIHHYLAAPPLYTVLSSRPFSRLFPFSAAGDSIISRLRFSEAIPPWDDILEASGSIEFVKSISPAAATVDGYERFTIVAGELTAEVHRCLLTLYAHCNPHWLPRARFPLVDSDITVMKRATRSARHLETRLIRLRSRRLSTTYKLMSGRGGGTARHVCRSLTCRGLSRPSPTWTRANGKCKTLSCNEATLNLGQATVTVDSNCWFENSYLSRESTILDTVNSKFQDLICMYMPYRD